MSDTKDETLIFQKPTLLPFGKPSDPLENWRKNSLQLRQELAETLKGTGRLLGEFHDLGDLTLHYSQPLAHQPNPDEEISNADKLGSTQASLGS